MSTPEPLRVCFITAEAAPLAKTGGLADVSGAMAKYLAANGHDIRLFLPAYRSIDLTALQIERPEALQHIALPLGARMFEYSILVARMSGWGCPLYLVDCPACFHRPIYTNDADEHLRFLLLTHAAFQGCQHLGFAPHILHCNDWHTAVGTLLLRSNYAWDRLFAGTRSVLTVHNLGYQGIVGAQAAGEVLAGSSISMLDQGELADGRINLLRTGLQYADLITTVSPTYAREIQSAEYGAGLDGLLRERADALVGILNGVDYEEWDPRNDRHLTQRFDPEHLAVKQALKLRLQQRLGLESHLAVPLIGMVSRLVAQKGFDILMAALPTLLERHEFNLLVLGNGDSGYEQFFAELEHRLPTRVHFARGYDEPLAHWIEAASDMFLMPSRYEPCGLNQLYSLRYGTIPIVRRTGGLADSVVHIDPASGNGTGIVFNDYNAEGLSWGVSTALELYQQPALWRRVMLNAMAQNFSWERQIGRYVDAYRRLLAARPTA